MKAAFERNANWIEFVMKVFGYIAVVNLFVLPILWISNILSAVIFVYEGAFLLFLGGAQLLLSLAYYRKNAHSTVNQRYPYPGSAWLDHRILFKRLTPEERKRYRQEGIVTASAGFGLWLIAIATYFLIFARWRLYARSQVRPIEIGEIRFVSYFRNSRMRPKPLFWDDSWWLHVALDLKIRVLNSVHEKLLRAHVELCKVDVSSRLCACMQLGCVACGSLCLISTSELTRELMYRLIQVWTCKSFCRM